MRVECLQDCAVTSNVRMARSRTFKPSALWPRRPARARRPMTSTDEFVPIVMKRECDNSSEWTLAPQNVMRAKSGCNQSIKTGWTRVT
jgi:hypothetical protein